MSGEGAARGGKVNPRSVRSQSSVRVECSPIHELFRAHPVRLRSLPAAAIDIWPLTLAGEDSAYGQCLHWLDQQERERAARFHRRQDSERYVLAHGGLRFILSLYLGLDPDRIELSSTSTGKPKLADLRPGGVPLTFNLSHAHGKAIVAITQGREVGEIGR